MELQSVKYKKRLIILGIIVIISIALGIFAERQVKGYADQVDQVVEKIQSIPEEEYEQRAEEENISKETFGYNKQKALELMQAIQAEYNQIFKYSEGQVILMFIFAIAGSIIGVMIYFIFLGWIINKLLPDLKKWLSIIIRILLLIILFRYVFYLLITLGVLAQIPFILYNLYKFIKLKRTENKDDIVKEKT